MNSKLTIYIGRFVLGLGSENLEVACNTYTASWFSGVALSFAFGLQISVARIGSAVSLMVMGPLYNEFLPDECKFNSTTVATTIRALSTEPTTSLVHISNTAYNGECAKEENKALGIALAIASAPACFSLFGGIIAGLLDKRRETLSMVNLEEQPKVCTLMKVRL